LFVSDIIMSKTQGNGDEWFDAASVSDDAFVRRDQPLEKWKGSARGYHQPVGFSDWETALLKGLTPEKAHADELANPTMKEMRQGSSDKR